MFFIFILSIFLIRNIIKIIYHFHKNSNESIIKLLQTRKKLKKFLKNYNLLNPLKKLDRIFCAVEKSYFDVTF